MIAQAPTLEDLGLFAVQQLEPGINRLRTLCNRFERSHRLEVIALAITDIFLGDVPEYTGDPDDIPENTMTLLLGWAFQELRAPLQAIEAQAAQMGISRSIAHQVVTVVLKQLA